MISDEKTILIQHDSAIENPTRCRWVPPYRFIVLFLLFLIKFNVAAHLYSLSFAITCMVTVVDFNVSDYHCLSSHNYSISSYSNQTISILENHITVGIRRPVDWDITVQSYILGAPEAGGLLGDFAAGMMIDKYGARWIMVLCFVIYSVTSVSFPYIAHFYWVYALLIRGFAAVACDSTGVIIQYVTVRWFRQQELATVMALAHTGTSIAGIFTMYVTGELCAANSNWPIIFFIDCGISVLVAILWLIFYFDNHDGALCISHNEIESLRQDSITTNQDGSLENQKSETLSVFNYKTVNDEITSKPLKTVELDENLNNQTERHIHPEARTHIHPMLLVLSSKPVWAIIISAFSAYYASVVITVFGPTYLKEIMCLTARERGIMSALPFVALLISRLIAGPSSDYIIHRYQVNDTTLTKIYMSILGITQAGCLGLITLFSPETKEWAIACLIGAQFAYGFTVCGYMRASCLIAPKFAGKIAGLLFMGMAVADFMAPIVTGRAAKGHSHEDWNAAFYVACGVSSFGVLVFLIFGSAELQPWAAETKSEQEN